MEYALPRYAREYYLGRGIRISSYRLNSTFSNFGAIAVFGFVAIEYAS